MRQVPDHARKGQALVCTRPYLAVRGAEIKPYRVARIGGQTLTLHRPPGLLLREALRHALPCSSAVARAIDRGTPARADAWPHVSAVHGEHPGRVRIARMQRNREADVAHLGRHV